MRKLSLYLNEIISIIVMLLMLVALVAGQANSQAYQLAARDAASNEAGETSHFRLEDE